MANSAHLQRLKQGAAFWNAWRNENRADEIDLRGANLAGLNLNWISLSGAHLDDAILSGCSLSNTSLSATTLRNADLSGAILTRANLHESDLGSAMLEEADLRDADLSKANLTRARAGKANFTSANLSESNLSNADLSWARLPNANLTRARMATAIFECADLGGADMSHSVLVGVHMRDAHLAHAKLDGARLMKANLCGADLGETHMDRADLTDANLTGASFYRAGLAFADFSRADLTGADLRAATVFRTRLNNAVLTDVLLWETQRSGWEIKDIQCERAFWDRRGKESIAYAPGEFERLYSEQTVIELFYQGGVSTFELNTLPALLQHLASLHSDAHIRLKSIEETGGGAKISISVGDADADTAEKIKTDAMQVYHAQLLLRDNDLERLRIENRILTGQNDKLISALLTAGTQHNTFNAPVYGAALSSGSSSATVHQTLNDNQAILDLIQKLLDHIQRLELPPADSARFESEADTVKAELQKPAPDKTLLSRSLGFIQKIGADVLTKSAEKLGEQALSGDWRLWLDQLGQMVHHLK